MAMPIKKTQNAPPNEIAILTVMVALITKTVFQKLGMSLLAHQNLSLAYARLDTFSITDLIPKLRKRAAVRVIFLAIKCQQ